MKLKDFFINESHEMRKLSDSARKGFLGIVARYQEYGSKLKRAHPLSEIAKTLGVVAEAAERFTLSESDEWFDEITIRRNMKELKKYNAEFQKEARNAHKLELRMQALYEDMGRVLGRYYEVKELAELKDRVDEHRNNGR